jgi:toxin ParE1/3/4
MRIEIERSDQALGDLEELTDYLRSKSVEVALRFVIASESTFRFILHNPGVGQLCNFSDPILSGVRVWRIDGFPNHLIYFKPTDRGVKIVRVLHGARDIDTLFGDPSES